MNIDVKIFNKILGNQTQQYIKTYMPQPSWIYIRYARTFQHLKISQYNP